MDKDKFKMNCEKDFAVVFFINENIYSEIPVSWLTEDRKQCWWPNIVNPKSRMIRREKPNNDGDDTLWTLYDIKLESYASTLESARKKAEQPDYVTGNEEFLGPRQIRKPRSFLNSQDNSSSDSEIVTPPPSPLSTLNPRNKKKKASKKSIKIIDKKLNSSPEFTSSAGTLPKTTTEENNNNQPPKIIIEMDGAEISHVPIIISEENISIQDLHKEIQQIAITCNRMDNYLSSIDNRLKALTLEKGNFECDRVLDTLMSRLPCKTNQDVEDLDRDIINNEELKRSFIQYIKRIGGKDAKDNVNRCLPHLFTNELGTRCSYVGFRGNFKLQHFAFINLFVEIVVLQHQCTLHEVEKHVGEWFRLSNQREKRGKKN